MFRNLIQTIVSFLCLTRSERRQRTLLNVENLENRLVLDSYYWTGAAMAQDPDLKWSTPGNWLANGNLALRAPDQRDDVVLDGTGVMGQIRNSNVDANFGGTVKSLSIYNTYNKTLTLNKQLTVLTYTFIWGGTIDGSKDLRVGPSAPGLPAPYFSWMAGTIKGSNSSSIVIDATATGYITGATSSTELRLEGDRHMDVRGNLTWTDGKIVLDGTQLSVTHGGTLNVAGETTPGLTMEGTGALNIHGATNSISHLNVSMSSAPNRPLQLTVRTFIGAHAEVSLARGEMQLNKNSSLWSGKIVLSIDTRFRFGSTATHRLEDFTITGTGTAYFNQNSTMRLTGTVTVNNVDDTSLLLEGTGDLQINGEYTWGGTKWTGGKVKVGQPNQTGAKLTIGEIGSSSFFTLERNIVNYAKVEWSRNDIKVGTGGGVENKAGALFDIKVDKSMTKEAGAGTFKNEAGAVLRKSAGAGTAKIKINYEDGGGLKQERSGTLETTEKMTLLNGSIEIDPSATYLAAAAFDHLGGNTSIRGTLEVLGNLIETGGTIAMLGGDAEVTSAFIQGSGGILLYELGASCGVITTAQRPTLAGQLDLDLVGSLSEGDEFTLIDNLSEDPICGTFSGLPEGENLLLSGWVFEISYEGGDGNDVVLTVIGQPGVWGRVFADVNGNGLRDSADAGLDGVTVTLLDNNLQFLDTATTADGGYYSFEALDVGTYTIAVAAPTGSSFTAQDVGSNDDVDSDVSSTGSSPPFIIDANTPIHSFDAGLYEKGNLSGLVWTDDDGDGLRDATEAARSFVAVQLLDAVGIVVAATSTAADGSYSFADVVPGEYALRINDATLSLSPSNVGIDDTLDSDFDPTERTVSVLLLSGQSFGHLDAGVFVPVTVQGKTWIDSDGDGVQGLLELSLADVPVTLFRADGVPLDDTTTNAFGSFTFSDVAPGSYYLVVDAPSASQPYYFTGQNQGGNDALDSDVNTFGITATFALTSGQSAATFDAGLFQLGSVGGMVWDDGNADGVRDGGESGRAATAVDLLNAQGNIVDSTATYSNGSYAFNGLVPGSYSVRYAQGAALMLAPQNVGGDDTIDSDAHPGTRLAAVAVVSATELTSVDAGVYDPLSVGGTAWIDSDGDGLLENGEPALAGVGVALLDELTQTTLASTTTAADGTYVFDNLPAGSYLIAFTAPAGHTFTVQGGDSDADPTTGRTATFALTPNQTAPQLDAGLYQPGSISGVVWEDNDGDGVRANGEPLLALIPVGLLDAAGNYLSMTSTAADGSYQFTNLAPGSYLVEVNLMLGQVATRPNQGGDDTRDSDLNGSGRATATVTSGQTTSHVDGGIATAVTVRGRAWSDDDADGIQDLLELGVSGVSVSLYLVDGTLVATTTTDFGGYYRFDDQLPGEYYLAFTAPAGYDFTLQNQGSNDSEDSDVDVDGLTGYFTMLSGQADALFDAGLNTI